MTIGKGAPVADYECMIPAGDWRVRLELKDGSWHDAPLVGWALSRHDLAMPFFVPPGGRSATELSTHAVAGNPAWGVESFEVYHPERIRAVTDVPLPEAGPR